MDPGNGIDEQEVTKWFVARFADVAPPLTFSLISGGKSNLTYLVQDRDQRRWALRRPPLGHVLATAHDVAREFRIMDALASTAVAVPQMVGLCEDASVNGAAFIVMEFVDGLVVRDAATAEALPFERRAVASTSVVDALAAIHAVDVEAVGLHSLARHDGYIERQLKRWLTQYNATRSTDVAAIERAHDALAATIPDQGPAGIVHGDFRLDNCVLRADGTVAAVLDWELCTLGDVMADLGLLLVYWSEPGEPSALDSPPTAVPGFLNRQQVIDRYATRTGRDLSALDFYVAFASWKVACILDGVRKRYSEGVMGESVDDDVLESYRVRIERLASQAESIAVGL